MIKKKLITPKWKNINNTLLTFVHCKNEWGETNIIIIMIKDKMVRFIYLS